MFSQTCAPNEGLDQPVQSHSLIKHFAGNLFDSEVAKTAKILNRLFGSKG